jgi:DNA-binding GntR family transcriptional regulator
MCSSSEPTGIHEPDQAFHVDIFMLAGNRVLLEIRGFLRPEHPIARKLPRFHDHSWVIAPAREHLDILRAIESGDAARARGAICAHLEQGARVRS